MSYFRCSVSLAAVALATMLAAPTAAKADDIVYNSIPSPLPPSSPSLGFQATSTSEFGDYITLAPGNQRHLTTATVTMTNWATQANYIGFGDPAGFLVPITLSLYNAVGGGLTPSVGALISSTAINAFIPWRPAADPGCTGGGYMSGGTCYNGQNINITFNINKDVPDSFIYGVAFNTQTYGSDPTGMGGPYNSLNVGLAITAPTVGTDVDPDSLYWNTAHQGFLTTGTAGTFGPDTNWAPYTPAVQFAAVPEPASMALLGAGLFSLAMVRRRRRA